MSNSQDNMSLLSPRNTIIVGPEKCNVAEAEIMDFRRAFANMLEALKKKMSETI